MRCTFKGANLDDDLRPWAQALREVARPQQVPLIELVDASFASVQALGQANADELATAAPGTRGFDRSHLGPKGVCVFSALVWPGLQAIVPALVPALKPVAPPAPDCVAVAPT